MLDTISEWWLNKSDRDQSDFIIKVGLTLQWIPLLVYAVWKLAQ